MSTLSSANVTDVNLVLKERTHMRLCLNMLIFTHNLGNWLIKTDTRQTDGRRDGGPDNIMLSACYVRRRHKNDNEIQTEN